jgi:hypothetical protein
MMAEKTRIVEPEEFAIVRQRLSKHVTLVVDMHTTIEQLLEAIFPVKFFLTLRIKTNSWLNGLKRRETVFSQQGQELLNTEA